VSKLHGAVSRSIFLPLFPKSPVEEIPVGSVTNGIHTASWDSEHSDRMWSGVCGKDRWFGTTERIGDQIRALSDDALWKLRTDNCEAQAKANYYNFYNRLSAGSSAQPQPLRAVADHHQLKG
jgi:glycogen phosphorylase